MGHPDFGFGSNLFQGLKPGNMEYFLARLKPCPDTELLTPIQKFRIFQGDKVFSSHPSVAAGRHGDRATREGWGTQIFLV
jgi:hypothetical protein